MHFNNSSFASRCLFAVKDSLSVNKLNLVILNENFSFIDLNKKVLSASLLILKAGI